MNLHGVFPPIPTTFRDDAFDAAAMRFNVARWMKTGLRGIVVLGTNGEAALVDDAEAVEVVAAAREEVPRGRPLIAGTGRESTRATIAATRAAAAAGADAVLVRTPGFFRAQMSTDGLVRHYLALADASPVPVLLYNFAAVTGVNLPLAAIVRLAEHPNVLGLKESGGDVAQVADQVQQTPDRFQVLVGSAPAFYASLCVGAIGGILALACVAPDLCVRLHTLTLEGRHADALPLQRRLTPLSRAVTTIYGIAGLKAALDLCGFKGGEPRPPLQGIGQEARSEIQQLLDALVEPEVVRS